MKWKIRSVFNDPNFTTLPMLREEIGVVKRFVYDLVCELADKKLVDEGWKDTCEIMFDRDARKGLERAMKDAKEGNLTEWEKVKDGGA